MIVPMPLTPPAAPAVTELGDVARELLAEWGIEARRVRAIGSALADGRWHSTGQLVRDHATSRRTVEGIVTRLRPWLEVREDGVRVLPGHEGRMAAAWASEPAPATPPGDLEASMAALMRGLPPSDRNLDHVLATPATAARRARFLGETFDLAGASVLCLGDHDLTSLALAQASPGADIAVVDVDERVLEHVDRTASQHGWRVRPLFADLRVELPRSLREGSDLVFSDPPYAPAGLRLFLERGLAGLRPRDVSRIVFCYGYGERHPALGLRVQSTFGGLHLVAEAILPAFNRYTGAETLGGASSLYVCRPTRRTWATAGRRQADDPRIYSRGQGAETARLEVLPAGTVEAARDAAGPEPPLLVGQGWPAETPSRPLRRYLDDIHAARRRPPFAGPPHAGVVAVSLRPHLGGYLPRVLLSAAARRLVLVVDPDAPAALREQRLAALVGLRYRVSVPAGGDPAVVVADRIEEPPADRAGRALRTLLDRAPATLGSAWREALIAAFAAEGRTITKNQARAAIAATPTGALHARSHVTELPLHRLRGLPGEVLASLEALDGAGA
jgi:branched-chain polyamine synthase A-like protein